MKTTRRNIDWSRQLASLAVTGAIAVVPTYGSLTSAQAAPVQQAQGSNHGTRFAHALDENVRMRGVVTRDLGGDQFEFRSDSNNRIYRVYFRRNDSEPRRLSVNDRVEVRGRLDRDLIVASNVDILRNRDDDDRGVGHADEVIVTGIVTRQLPGDQFEFRPSNRRVFRSRTYESDRVYRVVFHRNNNEPRRLTVGDLVEVRGHQDRDILVAHDVRILDNRNNRGGNTFPRTGKRVALRGTVIRNMSGDRFQMQTDGGDTYIVHLRRNEPNRLSVGDRVSLVGINNKPDFYADEITVTRNRDRDDRRNVTLTGRVTRDTNGNGFEMQDGGRTYIVRLRRNEPIRLSRNDLVEVSGSLFGREIIAERVRVVRDLNRSGNGDNPFRSGRAIDFAGRVVDVQSRTRLTVRGNNGRTYNVIARDAFSSRIDDGDDVRIVGVAVDSDTVRDARVVLEDDN